MKEALNSAAKASGRASAGQYVERILEHTVAVRDDHRLRAHVDAVVDRPLPRLLGIAQVWGAAGLTASAGLAGWVEMLLLRRTMNGRIGKTGLPASYVVKLWTAAIAGAATAWVVKLSIPMMPPVVAAILIIGPYGLVFLAMTLALQVEGAAQTLRIVLRRR